MFYMFEWNIGFIEIIDEIISMFVGVSFDQFYFVMIIDVNGCMSILGLVMFDCLGMGGDFIIYVGNEMVVEGGFICILVKVSGVLFII